MNKDRILKILRVISSASPLGGGPIYSLLESSTALEDRGVSVHILTLDHPNDSFLKKIPFTLFPLGKGAKFKYHYNKIVAKWLVNHIDNYDVVIIEGLWQNHSRITAKIAKQKNCPYLVIPHGMLAPWFKKFHFKYQLKRLFWILFERSVINNAQGVLFTCKQELLSARESFPFYFPKEKIVSLGCGSVSPENISNILNIDFEYYLFLGRIDPIKGIDNLIIGYANAKSRTTRTMPKIMLVGPSSKKYEMQLKSLALEYKVESDIVFYGPCFNEQKWELINKSSALILPSFHENFGMVVCEALSLGVPVLISKYVNIQCDIFEEKAGVIFDNSPQGIALTLLSFTDMSSCRKNEMSKNGLNMYNKFYTNKSAAIALNNVIESVYQSVKVR